MAIKVLIIGESGTGKSTSMRYLDPAKTAIVNPVGKPLPFKKSMGASYDMLNNVTHAGEIINFMNQEVKLGKKVIVIDDFQYILSIPYMDRIKESGWDKWNDFGSNYFDIINKVNTYPDDVTVYFLSHCETLDNGVTTVKLIGKMLREKITIEGLFTIVLRTGVKDGRYYFYTQNDGKDTTKSPLDMFSTYAIDNDLNYVDAKIRNYYEISDAKTDAEIKEMDKKAEVEDVAPATVSRRSRNKAAMEKAEADMKLHEQAAEMVANGREEVPYNEIKAAEDALKNIEPADDTVPFIENTTPETPEEQPKRRTRRTRE